MMMGRNFLLTDNVLKGVEKNKEQLEKKDEFKQ